MKLAALKAHANGPNIVGPNNVVICCVQHKQLVEVLVLNNCAVAATGKCEAVFAVTSYKFISL